MLTKLHYAVTNELDTASGVRKYIFYGEDFKKIRVYEIRNHLNRPLKEMSLFNGRMINRGIIEDD
jgi:hypothetical protein